MKFNETLVEGLLLKRYKRFFADVEWTDAATQRKQLLTIHVPNTGSMRSVITPAGGPQRCWFSVSNDPARKLKGTLEAVQTHDLVWVGVNTLHPNKIVHEAAQSSILAETPFFKHWQNHKFYKSEHKISKETRLDGVFYRDEKDLENAKSKKHFVEIKNTTLMTLIDGVKHAQFPDSVTERGQKHLVELTKLIEDGHRSELVFTIQRNDVECFSIAADIDPKYAKLFQLALAKGLMVTPVVVDFDRNGTVLSKKILAIK